MTGMLHSKNGMTLVELIVAMAISLVLAGSLYQIFISSTRTYALNEGLARLQENSRFAIKVLRRDIRQAGYLGCLQDNAAYTNTLNDPTDFLFNFDQAVYGLEATSATTWASELGPADPTTTGFNGMNLIDPVGGSDILAIRGMMGNQLFFLETPMPDTSADMKLEDGTTDAREMAHEGAAWGGLYTTGCHVVPPTRPVLQVFPVRSGSAAPDRAPPVVVGP